jgi:hypothetical protein
MYVPKLSGPMCNGFSIEYHKQARFCLRFGERRQAELRSDRRLYNLVPEG